MIVWGGVTHLGAYYNDGGAYTPTSRIITPPWWTGPNGANCDDTNYYNNSPSHAHSTVITSWNGLDVCGPRPLGNPNLDAPVLFSPNPTTTEYEWECTELVKRYLLLAHSTPSIVAYGDQVVANYASAYPSVYMSIANDGTTHVFPKAGDVLSYSDVHTAIVKAITVTDQVNGNATLHLIEQNASATGQTTQKVVGWKIKGDKDDPKATGPDTVTAWLTPR